MAKLVTPNKCYSGGKGKKYHFLKAGSRASAVCGRLFPGIWGAEYMIEKRIDAVTAEELCKSCLGAMVAED